MTQRMMWFGLLALLAMGAVAGDAQTYTALYTFTGNTDGGYPQYGGLIMDSSGNLYGTATFGGNLSCPYVGGPGLGCGVVFKLNPTTGVETVLYTFQGGKDGAQPWAGLTMDSAGNLYGTAAFTGAHGSGVVYKVEPTTGHQTVMHAFGGTDGAIPSGELVQDSQGNFYSTTVEGGNLNLCLGVGCGVVFKMSGSGQYKRLYAFNGPSGDGANPTHGIIRDSAGNLYGATENGGPDGCVNNESFEAIFTNVVGCGTIFKLIPSTGQEMELYSFNVMPDGSDPRTTLIHDSSGNLYGTNYYGGSSGYGTVFELSPSGVETILYSFTGLTDGGGPWGGVVRDNAGNLYGTTNHGGGACGCGTVFKLSPLGVLTVLHTFQGSDGQYPEAPLLLHKGVLYGITSGGGTVSGGGGTGVIFKITP